MSCKADHKYFLEFEFSVDHTRKINAQVCIIFFSHSNRLKEDLKQQAWQILLSSMLILKFYSAKIL